MKSDRTRKAINNTIADLLSYFIVTILKFIVKTVFVKYIGMEIMGLSNTFTSIVAVFSLAELGFGVTMCSVLYKPLADGNTEEVKSIVRLVRKVFSAVGIIVFAGGLIFTPFINFFAKGNILSLWETQLCFILFVIYSSVSYFNTYKVILVQSDQKKYIEKKFVSVFTTLTSIFQIVFIILFKNFELYLATQIVFIILQNLFVSKAVNKLYPYIKDKNVLPLDSAKKQKILKDTIALAAYKVGAIIVSTTDNLLISSNEALGVGVSGQFSFYTMIVTSVTLLAYQIVGASAASIGNLWVTENEENVYSVYKKINFLQFWLSTFCSIGIFVLTEPVIKVWVGEANQLGQTLVGIITLNFYLSTMRTQILLFKDARGLFLQDKYKPIFESGFNLIFSIILMKYFGLIGILIGTTISIVTVPLWVEPYVLFKHGFKRSMKEYFIRYVCQMAFAAILLLLTYSICRCIILNNIIAEIALKLVVVLILPNAIIAVVSLRTEEFKYYLALARRILNFITRKKKPGEDNKGA